jgi:hypothetical protein
LKKKRTVEWEVILFNKSRLILTSSALALFSSAALFSGAAHAQQSGFEGGLRTGYGMPLGKAADRGADLSDGIAHIVPLWVDAGYRATENLFVGGYFQYGLGAVGSAFDDACDSTGVNCSTSSLRLGAQIHYHFSPRTTADPWLGYGFGYEWYKLNFIPRGTSTSALSSPSRSISTVRWMSDAQVWWPRRRAATSSES